MSTSDLLTPLRMLGYQVRIWEWWLDNHVATDRLPAIIPVVVHHSDSGWRAATEFSEIIDLDPDTLALVGAYLPKFRLLLDDLSHLDESAIEARRLTAAAKVTGGVSAAAALEQGSESRGGSGRWVAQAASPG